MQKTVIGWDIDTVDQVLTLPQVIPFITLKFSIIIIVLDTLPPATSMINSKFSY